MSQLQKESDAQVLIVDDEEDFREILAEIISRAGYVVHTAGDGEAALNLFQKIEFDVVLADFLMPKMNGLELMRELKRIDKDVAVIFITGQGSIESAVDAMKEGAYDYITKPIQFEDLENLLKRLFENRRLVLENRQLRKVLRQKYSFQNIIANSKVMMEVIRKIELAAQNQVPVLIQGEPGTGKELIAKTIHFNSDRAAKNFLPQDCSALSDDLLIDEWIGREFNQNQTSYTKKGIFRLATRGTVFLKEISALSKNGQQMLLQILRTGKLSPRDSQTIHEIDIRLITASRIDIFDPVRQGRFDPELFRLISELKIDLPPLRERAGDIPKLIDYFLQEKGVENQISFAPDTLDILKAYDWPQNVWELKNVVESACAVQHEGIVLKEHLPDYLISKRPRTGALKSLRAIEKEAIQNTLQSCLGNARQAAEILGISLSSFYRKKKKYQIQ